MNEASNFCPWPCTNPESFTAKIGNPPPSQPLRNNSRPSIPGFPDDFQPTPGASLQPAGHEKRDLESPQRAGKKLGLPGRNLVDPPYRIHNAAGSLSNMTLFSDLIHANGIAEYDAHNLYGTMMSAASREAMLARRPGRRPLVITRSTFAGAGRQVGHWLGDNVSSWSSYRISISELIAFVSLFQVPMVGSDVCGFIDNTTETLCARWATLGAFSPFYRNHNALDTIGQEFYRWPLVAGAARTAISVRYRLLDYIYTAMYRQTIDGTPLLSPLWFAYPEDRNTFPIDLQYLYGDSLLVSPVTEENATSVKIYLPDDIYYDFWTHEPIRGKADWITLKDVPFTTIPLHIKGGSILPLRVASAKTTSELREKNFELIIAPGLDGTASGSLYLDEGDAIDQPSTSLIKFSYDGKKLKMVGSYGYSTNACIERVSFLRHDSQLGARSKMEQISIQKGANSKVVHAKVPLTGDYEWTLV